MEKGPLVSEKVPLSSGIMLSGCDVQNRCSRLENVRETPPEVEAGRESQRSRARSPCATSLTTLHLDFRFGGVTPSYPIEAIVSRVSCYMQPTASQLIQKVAADHIPPSHREKLRLRNVKCYMSQLVLSNPESEFLTTSLQSFQACLPLEAYTTI